MRCERCGLEMRVGDFPFCRGSQDDHKGATAHAIQSNERFIGGMTVENMGNEPVTVYSREEFKKAMDARGLEQRIKYVPGDKYLTNWAAGIDAQTLENVKVLLSRGQQTKEPDPAALQSFRSSVRAIGSFTVDTPIGE